MKFIEHILTMQTIKFFFCYSENRNHGKEYTQQKNKMGQLNLTEFIIRWDVYLGLI